MAFVSYLTRFVKSSTAFVRNLQGFGRELQGFGRTCAASDAIYWPSDEITYSDVSIPKPVRV
jgi:hypothetical protein